MRKRTAFLASVLLFTTFLLTGCFSNPKDEFLKAHEKVFQAEKYAIEIQMHGDYKTFFQMTEKEQDRFKLFDSSSLSLKVTADKPLSKYEWFVSAKDDEGEIFHFPAYSDSSALYYKIDGLTKFPHFPKNKTEKFIKFDYEKHNVQKQKVNAIITVFGDVVREFATQIQQLPDSSFTELKDGRIQVRLNEDEYKRLNTNLYASFLEGYVKLPDINQYVDTEEVKKSEELFKQSLDELTIDDVKIISTINNGVITRDEIVIHTRLISDKKSYQADVYLTFNYSLNENDISFTVDPTTIETLDPEDVTLPY